MVLFVELVSIVGGQCMTDRHCPPKALSVRGDMDSDQLHVTAISSWNRMWLTLRTMPLLNAHFLQSTHRCSMNFTCFMQVCNNMDLFFMLYWLYWFQEHLKMEPGALQNQCRILFLLHFLSCCFARKIHSSDPIPTMILFKCVRVCVCAFVVTCSYLSSIAIEDSMPTYWFTTGYWFGYRYQSWRIVFRGTCPGKVLKVSCNRRSSLRSPNFPNKYGEYMRIRLPEGCSNENIVNTCKYCVNTCNRSNRSNRNIIIQAYSSYIIYTLKRFRVSRRTPSGVVTRWCNESTGSPQEHQQS